MAQVLVEAQAAIRRVYPPFSKVQTQVESLTVDMSKEGDKSTYLNDQMVGLRALTDANAAELEALKNWASGELNTLGGGVHDARMRDRARVEALEVEVKRSRKEREAEREDMEGMREEFKLLRA